MSEIPEKVAYILKHLRTLAYPTPPEEREGETRLTLDAPPVVCAIEVSYPRPQHAALTPRYETTVKLSWTNGLEIEVPVCAVTVTKLPE